MRTTPTTTSLLVLAAAVGVVLHEAAPGLLRRLAAEDGPLETVQALCFLAGALGCAWGVARRTASRWAVPVGLVCLLLLGEEISWGQRLAGFSGPTSVTDRNRQREFNVHNLDGVNDGIRDVGVVVLLLGVLALPVLARRSDACARSLPASASSYRPASAPRPPSSRSPTCASRGGWGATTSASTSAASCSSR